MASTVVVRDLEKRYGEVHAARGVSFAIEDGEVFGLLGPNGAGKTTTVECILGLREPDAGSIEICGLDARRRPREVKQKIGAALQASSLQDKITPREALRLFGAFYADVVEPQVLLDRFGLSEKAGAAYDTLSSGERQRLALALAFVNNPDLVFLDEPTTGLDPRSRRELHGEIERMKRDGHTVLLTTHHLDEAERLCDRVAIIDRGRIIATGAPRALIARASPMQSVTIDAARAIDRKWLAGTPGIEDLTCEGTRARFRTADAGRALAAVLPKLARQKAEIVELHVQKATLEDVFLALTTHSTGSRTPHATGSQTP